MGAYFLKKQARSPILEGFGRNIYALLSFSGQQYKVIYCSTTVLDTVLAIPNPPIIYLAIKKATKLKKAAHNTAWKGVRTLVDTIVAMEFAAS